MRTWYPVSAIKYYNPVLSLLAPHSEDNSGGDGSGWVAMRTVRAVREGKGLPIPSSADSEYRVPPSCILFCLVFTFRLRQLAHPARAPRFQSIAYPKGPSSSVALCLQAKTAFKAEETYYGNQEKGRYLLLSLLHVLPPTHLQFQVVQEPQERRLTAIVQQIRTIKNERERANKQMKQAKSAVHKKQKAEEEQKRLVKVRAAKKRMFQLEHKERQRLQKRQRIK